MYPNVSNTNQQMLVKTIHEGLWLSVGLHKRTRCCHSQWKCYRPLKSICAANSRDQCYCHQLLDYLHPSTSTCAAVWRLQRIVCGRQHTFLKKKDLRIDMLCSKLDQGPCLIYQSYIYIKYMYAAYMHLYRNHINLSNKSYSDMTKSLIPGSSTELDPDPGGASIETSCKLNWSSQHFWTWHNF